MERGVPGRDLSQVKKNASCPPGEDPAHSGGRGGRQSSVGQPLRGRTGSNPCSSSRVPGTVSTCLGGLESQALAREWVEVPGQPVGPLQPDSSKCCFGLPPLGIKRQEALPRSPSSQKGRILYTGGKTCILWAYKPIPEARRQIPHLLLPGFYCSWLLALSLPSLPVTAVDSELVSSIPDTWGLQSGRARDPGKEPSHREGTLPTTLQVCSSGQVT